MRAVSIVYAVLALLFSCTCLMLISGRQAGKHTANSDLTKAPTINHLDKVKRTTQPNAAHLLIQAEEQMLLLANATAGWCKQ